jgi:MFS family permease
MPSRAGGNGTGWQQEAIAGSGQDRLDQEDVIVLHVQETVTGTRVARAMPRSRMGPHLAATRKKAGGMALKYVDVTPVQKRLNTSAIRRVFIIHAMLTASWAPRIPAVQEHLRLNDAQFGIALAGAPLAEMAAVFLMGRLVAAHGSKIPLRWLLPLFCLAAPLPGIANSQAMLFVSLAVWGALGGGTNIAMNAQALVEESNTEQLLLSRLHGLWSLGALAGAGLGTLAAAASVPVWLQMGATAVPGLTVALACMPGLADGRTRSAIPATSARDAALRRVIVLGLLAVIYFCAQFAEGSADNWGATFFAETSRLRVGLGGIGYAAYAVSMCCGRLVGDHVVQRFGPVATVCCSASIAALGFGAALLWRGEVTGLAGLILLGLGFSMVIPLAIRASSQAPQMAAGRSLSVVTGIGSIGMVCGPPVVGLVAATATLPAAMGLVVVAAVVVVAASPAVRIAGGGERPGQRHWPASRGH